MNALITPITAALVPPSPAMLEQLNEINKIILSYPQTELVTEHLIHGGMYARTIRLVPDTKMMGSLILHATTLVIHGDCSILIGDSRVELTGYNVIPGCAGRKSFFWTHGPVEMTMFYATSAETVTEAEDEIFGEADRLISRKDGSRDMVTITGQEGSWQAQSRPQPPL
jgi:hypothetical protein